MKQADSILLLSGGIDSTTLLAQLAFDGRHPLALIFDYGQTLRKEVDLAVRNAEDWGALHAVIEAPLNFLPVNCPILGAAGSPLPTGRTRNEIAASGTPPSYVPFRNGIFLAYAVAYGESLGVSDIYCGGNGLDSGNYWDDTAEFAAAFQTAANVGTTQEYKARIHFPWADLHKWEIVARGIGLGVDYSLTWSCYGNGAHHCGACDSCIQRQFALKEGRRHAAIPG